MVTVSAALKGCLTDLGVPEERVEVLRNGVGGINGLDAPVDLVATPDALHVYVAAFADDAVAGFRVIQILFRDGFESGDVSAWDGSNP